MSKKPIIASNVSRVGGLIERDIRHKGLAVGQPYLTAQEAASAFGVSAPLAGRAMRALADRDVLVRRPGAGTFVGPLANAAPQLRLRCVHVVISPARLRSSLEVGQLTEGLMSALPGYNVQINVLPDDGALAHLRQMVEKASEIGWLSGLVLVGCGREIQELVLELQVPAVVFGGVFATTRRLPSADVDQHASGRLMATLAMERGHCRMGLVMRDRWLPGDNQLLDGINEVLAEAGLNHGSMIVRSLPVDRELAVAELRELLGGANRPTVLICRGRFFGEAAHSAAQAMGLRVGEDLMLVSDAESIRSAADLPWPKVCPELDYKAQAAIVGQLLREYIEGHPDRPQHKVIPVRLAEPAEYKRDEEVRTGTDSAR